MGRGWSIMTVMVKNMSYGKVKGGGDAVGSLLADIVGWALMLLKDMASAPLDRTVVGLVEEGYVRQARVDDVTLIRADGRLFWKYWDLDDEQNKQ